MREDPSEVRALIQSGKRLRQAQEAAVSGKKGADLNAAIQEHRAALDRVQRDLRRRKLSGPTLEKAMQTLRVTSVDPELQPLLERGILHEDLTASGFGLDPGLVPARPKQPAAAAKPKPKPKAKPKPDPKLRAKLKAAEAELADAEKRAEQALRDLERAKAGRRARPASGGRGRTLKCASSASPLPGAMSDTLVFIPAWNEEQNLPAVLDELRRELPDADVLVVDDGSTDRTAAVAREHGAEVLSFGENRGLRAGIAAGYTWALEHGYAYCGRVDADGQHPPRSCAGCSSSSGPARRTSPSARASSAARATSRTATSPEGIRKLGTGLLRRSMRVALGRPFNDATSGLYAASAKALPALSRAVRERRAGGRGGAAPARRGTARRGGAGRHARARERRVEAAGQEGVHARRSP